MSNEQFKMITEIHQKQFNLMLKIRSNVITDQQQQELMELWDQMNKALMNVSKI